MKIEIDLFIENPGYVKNLTSDEDIFYSELIGFIEGQLMPLKDEILIAENENKKAAIVINILKEDSEFFGLRGYPADMTKKMLACFSQEDFVYIFNKIERLISLRNN
jgi:hypothetical protein